MALNYQSGDKTMILERIISSSKLTQVVIIHTYRLIVIYGVIAFTDWLVDKPAHPFDKVLVFYVVIWNVCKLIVRFLKKTNKSEEVNE